MRDIDDKALAGHDLFNERIAGAGVENASPRENFRDVLVRDRDESAVTVKRLAVTGRKTGYAADAQTRGQDVEGLAQSGKGRRIGVKSVFIANDLDDDMPPGVIFDGRA